MFINPIPDIQMAKKYLGQTLGGGMGTFLWGCGYEKNKNKKTGTLKVDF